MKKTLALILFLVTLPAFSQSWDSTAWLHQRDSVRLVYRQFDWLAFKSLDQVRTEDSIYWLRWSPKITCQEISDRERSIDSSDIEKTLNTKLQRFMWDRDGSTRYYYEKLDPDKENSIIEWARTMSNYDAELQKRFPNK